MSRGLIGRLFWLGADWRLLAVLGLLFAAGGSWLATRPLPARPLPEG